MVSSLQQRLPNMTTNPNYPPTIVVPNASTATGGVSAKPTTSSSGLSSSGPQVVQAAGAKQPLAPEIVAN